MAETQSLKHKAVSGVLWKIVEQAGSTIIQLGISIILARLIMPDQFGMIAMLTVFTVIANAFVGSGLSIALIRKKNPTQIDCSTVFWYNVVVAIACYFILFLCAPLVERFYDMEGLANILRVTSIGIVIGSLTGVHSTLLTIDLDFKSQTKIKLFGIIISGVIGVIMAYMDFKVWALVAQSLTVITVGTLCLWMKVKWRPSFVFSRESFHEFFSFGSKMLASSLLYSVFSNMSSIIIGKVFRASDLAFYNRADAFTNMTARIPTGALQSVTYPALAKLKDDDEALKNGYRRILRVSAFVIFPLCLGTGAVAYPLINVLYTSRWMYTATLLSILVFGMMWHPIYTINLNYLTVKGRSDLFFRLEIIREIQMVVIWCITVPFGIEAMCYGTIFASCLNLLWNTHYSGKFLGMSILVQLKDLFPTLCLSLIMYAAARSVACMMGNGVDSLLCSVATGMVVYTGGALLFKFPEIKDLKNLRK